MKLQPKHRTSRQGRYLMLAAVGIVAIALVAVTMLWTKRGSTTPESILERLPNNLDAVSAWNIDQLWKHEALSSLWKNPLASQYLTEIQAQTGIDVMALKSAVAGSRLTDDGIEGFYVLEGRYDPDKINDLISTLCPNSIVISGKRLSVCDLSGLSVDPIVGLDELDSSPLEPSAQATTAETIDLGKEIADSGTDSGESIASIVAEPAPATSPPHTTMVVGAWDNQYLVAGTAGHIEAFFEGGDAVGKNPELAALLESIDPQAFAWGAADIATIAENIKRIIPGFEVIPALDGAALVFELTLTDALTLMLECRVADDQTAKSLTPLVQLGLGVALRAANEKLSVTGQPELLSGSAEASGDKVKLQIQFLLPKLPM